MDVMNSRKWRVYSHQNLGFFVNKKPPFNLNFEVGVNLPLLKYKVIHEF